MDSPGQGRRTKSVLATVTSTTDTDAKTTSASSTSASISTTSTKGLKHRSGSTSTSLKSSLSTLTTTTTTITDDDSTDNQSDASSSATRVPEDENTLWSLAPYCPSYSVAFKTLFMVRALAATYSNISDCDEVFNYWDPLHYLQYGSGLETWEYSPMYAIRSWAYILLHAIPAELARLAMSANSLQLFFIVRIMLGAVSAHCEATLYRAVVEEFDPRIGRYLLMALLTSAGMWISANALLPSTFAMYTTMLFFSQVLQQPTERSGKRTFWAIFWVGLGALLGWPFSAVVGIPFVIEDLLIHSRTISVKKTVRFRDWQWMRFKRIVLSSIRVLVLLMVPITLIDYYYYKKWVVVPLNIVLYNVFGGKDVGPDIYGTEPWWFYILNGLLNFNILFIAALVSLPILMLTSLVARDVLPSPPSRHGRAKSPTLVISFKLLPFYLWFAIFTAQPHKEERFLFVVYPLICFNAVMTLFMVQKLIQKALIKLIPSSSSIANGNRTGNSNGHIHHRNNNNNGSNNTGVNGYPTSKNRVTIHKYATGLVWIVLVASAGVSLARIVALYQHYSAPIPVYRKAYELVKVPEPGAHTTTPTATAAMTSLQTPKHNAVRVCVGKEWYRFPSHYFLPEGAKLGFIKSRFDGLLPGEFLEYEDEAAIEQRMEEAKKRSMIRKQNALASDKRKVKRKLKTTAGTAPMTSTPSTKEGGEGQGLDDDLLGSDVLDWRWSAERRPGTSYVPLQMNNKNLEVTAHHTPLEDCEYLVDLDWSGRSVDERQRIGEDPLEPSYLQQTERWEKLYCERYLDTAVGAGANRWVRAFWLPANLVEALTRGQQKVWGEYCLARRRR
ncbi:mannosyltransferase [Actinomortierella wolfii]|nr:mannosyltransferase [Actinomortierella wolfii]